MSIVYGEKVKKMMRRAEMGGYALGIVAWIALYLFWARICELLAMVLR